MNHHIKVHYIQENDYHHNKNLIQEIVVPMNDTIPADKEVVQLTTLQNKNLNSNSESNKNNTALESKVQQHTLPGDSLRSQLWTPFETNCLIKICNKYIDDTECAYSNYTNNKIYNCIRNEMMAMANVTRTTEQVIHRIDLLIKNGRIERKGFLEFNETDRQNLSSPTNQEQIEEMDYDKNLKGYIEYASSDQANINDGNLNYHENKPRQEVSRWSLVESQYMLKLYKKYIGAVRVHGGMFRNKKGMWERIAIDINKAFDLKRTGVHCENRFKTLKGRGRKGDVTQAILKDDTVPRRNSTISSSSINESINDNDTQQKESHEELATNHIPMTSNRGRRPKESNTSEQPVSGSILIRDTIIEILQTQEENRERQHREMLNLLGEFLTR